MNMVQNETGNRSAHNRCNWGGHNQKRKGSCLFPSGKPIRQIQNDSREIPCFSYTKKEPHNVQLVDGVHDATECRYYAPGNQDAGNPDASPEFMQQQIARDFKDKVAKIENPKHQSELLA